MYLSVALMLITPLALAPQDGHIVSIRQASSFARYRVTGQVLSTYVGSVDAPPMRQADLKGVYSLTTEPVDNLMVITGQVQDLSGTADKKPIPSADLKAARSGKWIYTAGDTALFLVNGRPAVPPQLSAPLWPIAWLPVTSEKPLKIGDELVLMYPFSLQSFLEDDPIGIIDVPVKLVFTGPEYPKTGRVWGFDIKTDITMEKPVKHPEDPNLNLRAKFLIDGFLKVERETGRLESSRVIMSMDLTLDGKKYPFAFSKAYGAVSSTFERIR